MTEYPSRARAFASRIDGLSETAPAFWEVGEGAAISYPAAGHASSASVEPTSYWFNHRNALIASAVSRFPPNGLIVDVGGGNGYVSLGLREAGFDTLVVEPGVIGAHHAHNRGLPVIQAPFETLAVPDDTIDAAGLFDVLEHIGDDAAALDALHATMVPGAMLYLTVPSFGWLWSSEDVYAGHFRRYTVDSLSRLIERHGFAVDYATYFFSILVPPIFLARTIPSRLHLTSAGRPARMNTDHTLPGGALGSTFSRSMKWEQRKVAAGETIPFGSSCLLVATRR